MAGPQCSPVSLIQHILLSVHSVLSIVRHKGVAVDRTCENFCPHEAYTLVEGN